MLWLHYTLQREQNKYMNIKRQRQSNVKIGALPSASHVESQRDVETLAMAFQNRD